MTLTNTTPPATGENQEKVLVIGAGFSIEGQVHGQGVVLVNGSVKGHVRADTVKLGESGHVDGHVECFQLDVAGKLDGSFAAENVLIRAGAMVHSSAQSISRGTLSLAGGLAGQLHVNKLKVESTGQLEGHTRARQMDVHGYVQGDILADDMVVRASGAVAGKLTYGNLSMERGSEVSGQLQRKDSAAGAPAPATATAPAPVAAPAAAKTTETVVVHFPVNVMQQLRKNPQDLKVSLANGDPLPDWITVDREHSWLVLGKEAFSQMVARGETIHLRLQAGTETLIFKLPPDAK
jgi:cytoskeletal protein CcmA (bactofilin family)